MHCHFQFTCKPIQRGRAGACVKVRNGVLLLGELPQASLQSLVTDYFDNDEPADQIPRQIGATHDPSIAARESCDAEDEKTRNRAKPGDRRGYVRGQIQIAKCGCHRKDAR